MGRCSRVRLCHGCRRTGNDTDQEKEKGKEVRQMPTRISATKWRDIQDAILAGVSVTEIRALLSTSAGTISNVKRSMGIPLRGTRPRRTRVPAEPRAVSSQPTAPPAAYTPQEYFQAIADGLRRRDADNTTLLQENNSLRTQMQQLEAENQRLLSDLNQCKHQMANWSGPTALPGRSLGNGG